MGVSEYNNNQFILAAQLGFIIDFHSMNIRICRVINL
jgi:hypothetical protein